MKSPVARFRIPALLGALGLALLGGKTTSAQAATFTVTKTADTNDGACNADCSLREAVVAANSSAGADTINIPAGTYTLSIANTGANATTIGEDAAATGDLDVTGPITITGAGAASTIIQGGSSNGIDKVFSFNPLGNSVGFAVSLAGVTIQNGRNTTTQYGANDEGGAFDFDAGATGSGSLTVSNCIFTNNSTLNGDGGAIALFDGGNVSISNTVISNNSVHTVGDSLFGGGAIFVGYSSNPSTLTITNCAIRGNSAPTEHTQAQQGGGIFLYSSGNTTNYSISHCEISGNSAGGDGGGVYAGAAVTLDNCTLSGNSSGGFGGAVLGNGLNLNSVTLGSNSATSGGAGIYENSGSLRLTNTLVSSSSPIALNAGASVDTANSKYNLIENGSGVGGLANGTNGNLIGVSAGLASAGVTNNGGALLPDGQPLGTIALAGGSRALDAGDPAVTGGTDERGLARVLRGPSGSARLDIGALEQQPALPQIAAQTILEDDTLTLPFSVGDATANGGTAGIDSISATSSNTTLVPNANLGISGNATSASRTLTVTPAANQNGTTTITITASDIYGGVTQTSQTSFVLTVTAVNDAPSINAVSDQNVPEDAGTQTINLSGISAGAPNESGQTVSMTATSSNSGLVPNPSVTYTSGSSTGTLTYKPVANQFGTANITVKLSDNGGTANGGVDTTTITFAINVTAVNDAPTINSISNQTVAQGAGAQTVNLTGISAGPSNESGQTITVVAISDNPALIPNPSVTYTSGNATGTLTYTPAANQFGTATIAVTVSDDGGTANGGVNATTTTFTVTVIGKPTANSQSVTTSFNTAKAITLTGTDPNTPPRSLTYTIASSPSHGTLSGTAPNLTYIPNAGYQGTDSVTFTVSNGSAVSNTATVSITVLAGTPTANAQSVTTSFNTAKAITLTGSDPGTPPLPLTYTIASQPSHGTLSGTAPNLTYTPNANYQGTDSFTFTVSNGTNTSAPATVNITVTPGTPTANSQSVTTNFNTARSITLTGTDPDVPPLSLTYTVTSGPSHGTLSGTAPNLTYTPNANYQGTDSFTFTVSNGTNTSAPATVDITVSAGVPTANSQPVTTAQDVAKAITLTGSEPSVPTLPLTYTIVSGPSHGTLSGTAPNLTYTPDMGYFGADSFTFTTSNGTNTSDPATVSITVVGEPTANSQSVTVEFNTSTSVTLTGTDPNTPPLGLTYTVTSAPAHGTLSGTAPNLTYTPNAGYRGNDSFEFTVSNGVNTSAPATVTLFVKAIAGAPGVTSATTSEDTQTTSGLVISRNAADGSEIAYFKISAITDGTLFLNDGTTPVADGDFITFAQGNAGLKFTPVPDFNGTAHFTVQGATSTTGEGLGAGTTVDITVTEVNDSPVAQNDTITDIAEDSGDYTIPFSTLLGNDVAGPANESGQTLTITGVGNAVGGTVTISGSNVIFSPTANFNGAAGFDYTVTDDGTTNGVADPLSATAHVSFSITSVNDAPTDITLSNNTVAENEPVGTAVGFLSTTDVDTSDTFTYTLVSGAGSDDNASFQIDGNVLETNASFDFETKNSYSVRARSTDAGGLFVEKSFTITVTDVYENRAPVITSLEVHPTGPKTDDPLTATVVATDADNDPLTYTYTWTRVRSGQSVVLQTTSNTTSPSDTLLTKGSIVVQGDTIIVSVVANDGLENSLPKSVSLTIANTPVLLTRINLKPATPRTNDVIIADVIAPDNDKVRPTLTYVWKKTSGGKTTTIQTTKSTASEDKYDLSKPTYGNKGDVITLTVTASDGQSSATLSQSVTVGNTVPVMSSITFASQKPTRTSIIRATAKGSDPDATEHVDTLTYSYKWRIGTRLLTGETTSNLDLSKYSFVKVGDKVSVEVRASDGTSLSAAQTASVIVGGVGTAPSAGAA